MGEQETIVRGGIGVMALVKGDQLTQQSRRPMLGQKAVIGVAISNANHQIDMNAQQNRQRHL